MTPSRDRPVVDLSLLVVRAVAGIIFTAHGYQKLLNLGGMWDMMGVLGILVTIGEFFGGLGLIVGFLSRFSAASLIVIMVGAIVQVHGQHGFFLGHGPESKLAEAGFEYNFALIGLLTPTVLAGPGWFSLGRMLPLPKSPWTGRPVLILE